MGIVYMLTYPVMPGLVKIGKTDQDDASKRVAQLYQTGVPVPFTLEYAARVDEPGRVEDAIHEAFAPNRINPKREFFRLEPDQPIAFLHLLHNAQDATTEVENGVVGIDQESAVAAQQERARRPNFNFEEMGIPRDSVLHSTRNDVTVTVVDHKRVCFGDEVLFLAPATQQMLGVSYPVSPRQFWTYNGRLLGQIYDEIYGV